MRNIKRYKRNRVIYVIKICYGVYNYVMPHCRATQKQQKINDKNEF